MPCIAVERLARTAIKTAFSGGEGMTILENAQCLGDGKQLTPFCEILTKKEQHVLTQVKIGPW